MASTTHDPPRHEGGHGAERQRLDTGLMTRRGQEIRGLGVADLLGLAWACIRVKGRAESPCMPPPSMHGFPGFPHHATHPLLTPEHNHFRISTAGPGAELEKTPDHPGTAQTHGHREGRDSPLLRLPAVVPRREGGQPSGSYAVTCGSPQL